VNIVVLESSDGVWRVESVLKHDQHLYRIIRSGELHAETPSLVEVHRVLTDGGALDRPSWI
jgi:hypothetical protein